VTPRSPRRPRFLTVLLAANSPEAWSLTETEEEYETERARLCRGMGLQPSEYDHLTFPQVQVWIAEHNRAAEKR